MVDAVAIFDVHATFDAELQATMADRVIFHSQIADIANSNE